MKRIISIAICFLILLSCQLPVQASSGVPQEVMDATKSVVRILAEHKKESYTGSGFVIKNDGNEVLIATNDHVVSDDPDRICIWVGEDRQVDAEIVFTIPSKDICVLRLTELVSLAPLTLSDEPAQHGAAIYAVGYPGAGDVLSDTLAHTSDSATITDGIISAIRTFTIEEGAKPVKLLQVNAAINSGNSGGPLFNTKGEVIGINTYKVNVESQGVFGSVDISELKILLNEYGIVLVANTPETEPLPTETEPLPTEEVIPVEESSNIPVSAIAIVAVLVILTAIVLFKVKSKKQLTLRTYMSNFPQGLSVGEAVAMLLPTAIALRNLHNNGKLHLQVSPDAILISAKGAVLKGPSKNEMDRHCSGFTAPEVYRGTGYGITSDVYSFAALLLFAATGKNPSNSLQQDVLCEEIAALESREPAFGAVVRKAMSFLPQDRTQSLQELIYDISAFHNHEFHIRQPSKEKVPRQQSAHTPLIYNESAEVVKQREEEKAAVAKQMQEEKVAAAKQKQEEKAAAAKQKQEAKAAAAKQKQEAKVAAAKQKQEAKAAAKQKKEEKAAVAKKKQEAKAAAAKQKQEAKAAIAKQRQEEKAAAAKQKQEAKAAIAKQRQEEKAATKPRLAKASKIIIPVICTAAVSVPLLFYIIIPSVQYNKAVSLVSAGRYEEAIAAFEAMGEYKDSAQQIDVCRESISEETYLEAIALMEQEAYMEAISIFEKLGNYKDSQEQIALCVESSEEATYQMALELLESKEFESAKQMFEKIPHYKASDSLIQTCKTELAQIRKKSAVKLMEAKEYKRALLEFEQAEANGIDCDAEIRECEIAYLDEYHIKRYRSKPYVTRGEPSGNPKNLACTDEGTVKVHSVTRVDLDNGCVRFTIDCTPPKCEFVTFFNPPDGNIFMFCEQNVPEPVRQTFVFDILKKDIKAAKELTIRFGESGGWIYVRNAY